jgi:hypothetical protein
MAEGLCQVGDNRLCNLTTRERNTTHCALSMYSLSQSLPQGSAAPHVAWPAKTRLTASPNSQAEGPKIDSDRCLLHPVGGECA